MSRPEGSGTRGGGPALGEVEARAAALAALVPGLKHELSEAATKEAALQAALQASKEEVASLRDRNDWLVKQYQDASRQMQTQLTSTSGTAALTGLLESGQAGVNEVCDALAFVAATGVRADLTSTLSSRSP